MKFRIQENEYSTENFVSLGEGKEGEVFCVDMKAVKLYHRFDRKSSLSSADVYRLKKLYTQVLEHPIDCAYDENDQYAGVVSNYIVSCGYQNFQTMKNSDFIQSIKKMEMDSKVYALHKYLIGDLQVQDSVFDRNGQFHLVDSGSYQYLPNATYSFLENENQMEIHRFVIFEVFDSLLAKQNISLKRKTEILDKLFLCASNYDEISSFLTDILLDDSTLFDDTKRFKKELIQRKK